MGTLREVQTKQIRPVSLSVSGPMLLSPENGASTMDATPTFTWTNVSGAARYRIQVAGDADFGVIVIDEVVTTPSYTPSTNLTFGTFHWRVRADVNKRWTNWSAAWTLAVGVPAVPTLQSPSDGATCDLQVTFDWTDVANATAYRIQVAKTSDFSLPTTDMTLGASQCSIGGLAGGTGYWRVCAGNEQGWGSWTSGRRFIVGPPWQPTLLSPQNHWSTSDRTPKFDWTGVSGATRYQLQLDSDSEFGSPTIDALPIQPTYTPAGDLAYGTYFFRVRAGNGLGWGLWSDEWQFTVAGSARPVLVYPEDGAQTRDPDLAFTWWGVCEATRYQIQLDKSQVFTSPAISQQLTGTPYKVTADLEYGLYYWRMRAGTETAWGSWTPARRITWGCPPEPPTLLSPQCGANTPVLAPTFEWADIHSTHTLQEASKFKIQVAEDSGFSSLVYSADSTSPRYTLTRDLTRGQYYWRVQSWNAVGWGPWSLEWNLTVGTVPTAPALESPTNGSVENTQTPRLEWDSVIGATEYRVQVDDNRDFSSPQVDKNVDNSLPYTVPSDRLRLYATFFWRVCAKNNLGWGPWSAAWSFKVEPWGPTLSSPPRGVPATERQPMFQWTLVNGATRYRIQISTDPNYGTTVIDHVTSDHSFRPASPLGYGTYCWRVCAGNDQTWGRWSSEIYPNSEPYEYTLVPST